MDFLVEIFLFIAIICVLFLVLRLNSLKNNFDSLKKESNLLKSQLNEEKSSSDVRESKLHRTILGLQDALSQEQQVIKNKEADLKNQEGILKSKEAELLKSIAEVEKNLEQETENRKKVASQKKSSEVRLGNVAETLAPFLDQFTFNPEDCVFLGRPIDYISFADEEVTFIEVKMGKSQLNAKQRHIRDLIKNNQVGWKEIRIK